MAKGRARWSKVSAYELCKRKFAGMASPEEEEAALKILALLRAGVRAQVFLVDGKLVVR